VNTHDFDQMSNVTSHTVAVPAAAAASRQAAPKERRIALAGAGMLSAAMAVSGVLIYAFHVLAARALGPHDYGQIAVLWAAMFLVVMMIFRPLEQTMSRAMADRRTRDEEVRSVLRSVGLLAAGISAVLVLAGALAWAPISDKLFLGDDTMTALLIGGIVGYGAAYVVRGVLAGVRWFPGYGLGLIADAVARLLIALPLLFVASKLTAAVAVVAAGIAGGLVPLVFGRRSLRGVLEHRSGDERFHMGAAVAFAGPAALIALGDQILINGGPLLVMGAGGADASKTAGIVFAATMLVRIPVFLFQGALASMLPNLTLLRTTADARAFRRTVLRGVGVLLAAGLAIVVGAAAFGPEALRILYGDEYAVARTPLVLLGAGVGCWLAAATVSQALLAGDRGKLASVAWLSSAALFVVLYPLLPGDELARMSGAFAVATAVDLALLVVVLTRRSRA
jgi:O-antigen/teichoic acid export membrane protein